MLSRVADTAFSSSDSITNLNTSAHPSTEKLSSGTFSTLAGLAQSTKQAFDVLFQLRRDFQSFDCLEVVAELLLGLCELHALIVYYQIIRLVI